MAGSKPRLYLIGPVTGKPNDNLGEFERAREILENGGCVVDIPHDFVHGGTPWESAMARSINVLTTSECIPTNPRRYIPHYDGIAMLDGWGQSRGAALEHVVATAIGIPCRPWREWMRKEVVDD